MPTQQETIEAQIALLDAQISSAITTGNVSYAIHGQSVNRGGQSIEELIKAKLALIALLDATVNGPWEVETRAIT